MALYFRTPTLNNAFLFADPHAGLVAQNQAPTADDQIFTIYDTAQNGSPIGRFIASDSDGEVVDYAISNSKLSISNTADIILKSNTGLVAGTTINAMVIFADDVDGTGSARVTINVIAAPVILPVINVPAPLTVIFPTGFSRLPISHVDVQRWLKSWSAVDVDSNPVEISFNIPSLMLVANSPIAVIATAVDSMNRTQTASSTITIQELNASLPVITEGTPEHYEQRGNRYYLIDE